MTNEPSPEAVTAPREALGKRLAELRAQEAELERRSNRLSLFRGLTFLTAAALFAAASLAGLGMPFWIASSAVFAVFVALVVAHVVVVTKSTEVATRVAISLRAEKRLDHDVADFPERGDRFLDPNHPYAGDLDIFGKGSLFQLVSTAHTAGGQATLASWLLGPATVATIAERQKAARELAPMLRYREELEARALRAKVAPQEVPKSEERAADKPASPARLAVAGDPFVEWTERSGPKLRSHPSTVLGLALVPITLALLTLDELSLLDSLGAFRHLWIVSIAFEAIALLGLRSRLEPLLAVVGPRDAPFGRVLGIVRTIEGQAFKTPLLARLRASIGGESGNDASRELETLTRILSFAELRRSALLLPLLNALFAWDLCTALLLERWRDRAGPKVAGWITAIGEMEALASFGALAFEHPTFTMPGVSGEKLGFEAKGLGHPLLPDVRRVINDVAFGDRASVLMVTGSNMSGKSTLLRSIGVNAALALAGAPVCASHLELGACRVWTSMRVADSLARGVSHFYAELTQLKAIVDAVDGGDRVLFLLDEILHGTNSRERQIGAKAVVRHLLEKGAIGAVSSHDLGLADLADETSGRVVNLHFEEQVSDGAMTFDYRLREGVVTSGNALRLMKMVGLDVAVVEP